MNKISAIVIAKNEEDRIADCLDALSFCDEIVVVDNDSKDRTPQIAERMGAKIFKSDSSDFSELRNVGLKKATGDWVFYVDADERVDAELRENIKHLIRGPVSPIVSHPRSSLENSLRSLDGTPSSRATPHSAYKVVRKNFYLGKHEWPQHEKMERLFRREELKGWKGKLHESPVIEGKAGELSGFLLHYTHRSLSQMLSKTIEWSRVEAELRYSAGHPKMSWWRFPRVMVGAFVNYYIVQRGFRVGTAGLVESMYQAFSIFVTYARLWELQNRKSKND